MLKIRRAKRFCSSTYGYQPHIREFVCVHMKMASFRLPFLVVISATRDTLLIFFVVCVAEAIRFLETFTCFCKC